jgi:hypothetical protein
MRRSLVCAVLSQLLSVAACGGHSMTLGDATGAQQAAPGTIGGACTPAQEKDPKYAGAAPEEVSIDEANPGCGAGDVCLVNHFEGRTSCPYGGPSGTCTVPGTGAEVTASVAPQCADRRPAEAVYCSCRCANSGGRTDDGASYCTCPGSTACVQVVSSIGTATDSFAGAYCVKTGTQWDPLASCQAMCDPTTKSCP